MIISTPMGKLKFEGLSFMQLLLLYTAFLMKHKKKKKALRCPGQTKSKELVKSMFALLCGISMSVMFCGVMF